MGRGNVCVHGDFEGLYYVDYDQYMIECDGDETPDFAEESFNSDMEYFSDLITKRFPSFAACDYWLNNDHRVILENELFQIALQDNVWSMAIKLLQKEHWCYNLEGLQQKHHMAYLNGMKDALLEMYESIGTYAGAWTSGSITRADERKAG